MELIEKYFGRELTPLQREQFARLSTLYAAWNEKINVISRQDIDQLYLRHVLHSLSIAQVCRFAPGARVLDVGTGGGFPGVPLAIFFPEARFTLVDSIGKKIRVVQGVVRELGLKNLTALQARVEQIQGPFDYVVSRAVTDTKTLLGWVWKKMESGQRGTLPNGMLCLKGGDLAEELAEADKPYTLYGISDFFAESFFETKKVVYLSFDRPEARVRTKRVPVRVGHVVIGGDAPVVVQSMTNTDTLDTEACVAQIERMAAAGCRVIRLTVQGLREAGNLRHIADALAAKGVRGPAADPAASIALVADIHFNPEVAFTAADYVDKIRINPGNYRDPSGQELRNLLRKCASQKVALRIGVNHGSLSPRIVEQYGDTPRGMAESAMEFLRICVQEGFDQVVVSMKSSHVRIMIYACRLLVAAMEAEGMNFPLHIGVTEAGDGLDGRVKSAVGIGTLLSEGIGDTIRVSLTESPEQEVPVARAIVAYCATRRGAIGKVENPDAYHRRESHPVGRLGGGQLPLLYHELNPFEQAALKRGEIALPEGRHGMEWREQIAAMTAAGDRRPVMLHKRYHETSIDLLAVRAAIDFGALFIDGLADGLWIENSHASITSAQMEELSLAILQAARVRISRTEYIACPGCGRTLYDLEKTLAAIRSRTSHLAGVRIAVMGCIVNGPGEMADADYGYVGEGRGLVTLYKGREVVRSHIPAEDALEALIDLIRAHGDWREATN